MAVNCHGASRWGFHERAEYLDRACTYGSGIYEAGVAFGVALCFVTRATGCNLTQWRQGANHPPGSLLKND